jgi:hypothetical protein
MSNYTEQQVALLKEVKNVTSLVRHMKHVLMYRTTPEEAGRINTAAMSGINGSNSTLTKRGRILNSVNRPRSLAESKVFENMPAQLITKGEIATLTASQLFDELRKRLMTINELLVSDKQMMTTSFARDLKYPSAEIAAIIRYATVVKVKSGYGIKAISETTGTNNSIIRQVVAAHKQGFGVEVNLSKSITKIDNLIKVVTNLLEEDPKNGKRVMGILGSLNNYMDDLKEYYAAALLVSGKDEIDVSKITTIALTQVEDISKELSKFCEPEV